MLQVPRSALGITASSKGLVAGRLVVHDQRAGGVPAGPPPGCSSHLLQPAAEPMTGPASATSALPCLVTRNTSAPMPACGAPSPPNAGTETDCAALGGAGMQIPGDIAHISRHYAYQSDAQLVVVVEKDAVFQVAGGVGQAGRQLVAEREWQGQLAEGWSESRMGRDRNEDGAGRGSYPLHPVRHCSAKPGVRHGTAPHM